MSVFSQNEIEYLGSGLLGRLATAGRDGTPHVAPVGMFSHNAALGTIDIGGRALTNTKKFRDPEIRARRPRRGRSCLHRPVASPRDRGPRTGGSDRGTETGHPHLPGAHRRLGPRHQRIPAE